MTEAATKELIRDAEAYLSPYERWKQQEGLLTVGGFFIKDLLEIELTPWQSRGGAGVFINLDGTGGFNDTYMYELGPGQSSAPIRHIYEETVYILAGNGATSVWIDEHQKQSFEWHERSYFAIPPNAWHQYHNASGNQPLRYLAMTAAPRVLDTFKSTDFVFNNPYMFKDRFSGEENYFTEGPQSESRIWSTNFVADVLASTPKPEDVSDDGRGGGSVSLVFAMVNSTVRSHSRSWPMGAYAKFHRHGPGIHVLILEGQGYSLLGPNKDQLQRIDWAPGSMFVPPEGWWHAHFNTGAGQGAFLAIGWGSDKPKSGGKGYVYKSVKEGGDQWDYEDEDRAIHAEFEAELAKNGMKCRMGGTHPYCTQKER